MNSKLILCLAFVLCGIFPSHSANLLAPLASGDWSKAVNGLRGRLLFDEDPKFNGTRMGAVYLELQNDSDGANPVEIHYDIDHGLQCELLDKTGKAVAHAPAPADIMTPGSYWIRLPCDSVLRFRISVTGYGIPKDAGLAIGLMSGFRIIPPNASGDYYLSATFSATNAPDQSHFRPWNGVLKLPKLRIPVNQSPSKTFGAEINKNTNLTEQFSGILAECQKIKSGMTRSELEKVFTTEGGIWIATHRTYVYRGCRYIKVDVDFKLSDPKQDVLKPRPTDTISKISKPYLEWGITD